MTELTDEQIAREEKFLEGIPRLNIGALFLPPIWGPAHGMWAAILFYPIWLFADNTFYAAFTERTPLAIGIALIVLLTLTVGTVVFAILGQPFAAHRAASLGQDKETYLKRRAHLDDSERDRRHRDDRGGDVLQLGHPPDGGGVRWVLPGASRCSALATSLCSTTA